MIARINEECNLENCAQQARANQLQQQENEMETGNSWLLKVSISSFFFSLLILHFNQYKFYSQESFHYSQLEKLLDIDSEFVALLKLEVINQLFDHWLVYSSASIHRSVLTTTGTQSRSTGWCYTGIHQSFVHEISTSNIILDRFCDRNNFHLSDIQLLSIVEDRWPYWPIRGPITLYWPITACPPWPSPWPLTTPRGSTSSRTEATNPTRGSGYSATWSAPSLEPTGAFLQYRKGNRPINYLILGTGKLRINVFVSVLLELYREIL